VAAEKVSDFSKNFKKYYNTKDKKMNEAVKLTQQILLGNVAPDLGVGVETRSMKKASAQKTAEKKETPKAQKSGADPTIKKLFQEDPEPQTVSELNVLREVLKE
jgi:hypothetical protein